MCSVFHSNGLVMAIFQVVAILIAYTLLHSSPFLLVTENIVEVNCDDIYVDRIRWAGQPYLQDFHLTPHHDQNVPRLMIRSSSWRI